LEPFFALQAVPPWALVLLSLSKRIHSIFVLRLFNDAVAMFIAYGAAALMLKERWIMSIIGFSLAVSVKMNVLLLAPSVLVVLMKVGPYLHALKGSGPSRVATAVNGTNLSVALILNGTVLFAVQVTTFQKILLGSVGGFLVQVLLGLPFLMQFPASYLSRAFELSRVFTHRWSVNLKFLPEQTFQSKKVAITLLAVHLALLYLFASCR
jgi:alpha-1,3-mannosyltransferase